MTTLNCNYNAEVRCAEGLKPGTGSILVKGYDTIGKATYGVSVDAQERTNAKGPGVRGLLVEIKETCRLEREGRSFVDADEIPELLKGLDALLAITANPTQFKMFEVQYTTRDELHGRDRAIASMGRHVLKTPVRTPQANAFCERLIGTMRRECLDWLSPVHEGHLRSTLREWVTHYHRGRPHASLGPGNPIRCPNGSRPCPPVIASPNTVG